MNRSNNKYITIYSSTNVIESPFNFRDDVQQIPEVVPLPDDAEDYRPFDDGMGVELQQYPAAPAAMEQDDQVENVFQVPEGKRRPTVDEQRFEKAIDVDKSFDEMYPPDKTKKRRAARAFFQLLSKFKLVYWHPSFFCY